MDAFLAELRATNLAIVRFDGASFAEHAENEIRLANLISSYSHFAELLARNATNLRQLTRTRKILLRQTKRTVAALSGLLQTTRETYEVSLLPHG